MSRDEEIASSKSPGILRAQAMNEVLPRRDLDIFTTSRMFPEGDWVLSEVGRPHQFQAAYCVPNQRGHLVPAPMPPVNISAVTNEEEIYNHCTVYQFAPAYQSRGDTALHGASNAASHQPQQHLGRRLAATNGDYQQLPPHSQPADQYRFDSEKKDPFIHSGDTSFFASPPSYASATAAHLHAPRPRDKETDLPPAPMHGQNFISFSEENIVGEFQAHPSIGASSFASTMFNDSFRNSPESEEIHGFESFTSQDFSSNIHGQAIIASDSFDMGFAPPMTTHLHELALEDIFPTGNGSSKGGQSHDDDEDAHGESEIISVKAQR
ncbi:hypothetical protein RB213_005075 [Colletotrichum asianum]